MEKTKQIDEILSGLDGVQRASAPEFFYTRLKARMEKGFEPVLQQIFEVRLGLLGLWVIGPQLQEPSLGAISAIALLSRSDELAVRIVQTLDNLLRLFVMHSQVQHFAFSPFEWLSQFAQSNFGIEVLNEYARNDIPGISQIQVIVSHDD